jgi:hypothetical protein
MLAIALLSSLEITDNVFASNNEFFAPSSLPDKNWRYEVKNKSVFISNRIAGKKKTRAELSIKGFKYLGYFFGLDFLYTNAEIPLGGLVSAKA